MRWGANFINSCLESFAETFREEAEKDASIRGQYEIVMSILSNYVPNCLVRAEVHCPVDELEIAHLKGMAAAKKIRASARYCQRRCIPRHHSQQRYNERHRLGDFSHR